MPDGKDVLWKQGLKPPAIGKQIARVGVGVVVGSSGMSSEGLAKRGTELMLPWAPASLGADAMLARLGTVWTDVSSELVLARAPALLGADAMLARLSTVWTVVSSLRMAVARPWAVV